MSSSIMDEANSPISPTSITTNLIHRDESEIRQRLLHKLGFGVGADNQQPSKASPKQKKLEEEYVPTPPPSSRRKSASSAAATTSIIQQHPYLSLLDRNTCHREILELHPQLAFQEQKKLQFVPYVDVVNIPSHRDYPDEVYNTLWNTLDEIQHNGLRNTLEFQADNGDWRKAREEDVFIGVDGELFHPETYRQVKKRRHKRNKKRKGNIPKKSVQKGGNAARINAIRVAKMRGAGASFTRFTDS